MCNVAAEIIRCTNFAAMKHTNQRRKDPDQTPYINHPIGVAYILTHEGSVTDLAVIQAALLHDTVEDTDTSYDELVDTFGKEIADIVMEVSDDKNLSKEDRKRLQVEVAPHKTPKAKLVMLADKLYNLRDLRRVTPIGWSEERVQQYFEWAFRVVSGLRGTNAALENALDSLFQERGLKV